MIIAEIEETTIEKETEAPTEPPTEPETEPPTEEVGKNIDSLSDFIYRGVVKNDATENLRYSRVSDAEIDMAEYAVSYYHKHMKENQIHAIINFGNNTTTKIETSSIEPDSLYITVYNYVDGEELDANKMFSGNIIAYYKVNIETGAIESADSQTFIQAEVITEPETEPVQEPEPIPQPEPVQPPQPEPVAPQPQQILFILNTDTNCVHLKDSCSAAQKILPENYATVYIWEDDLPNYAYTYWACGICAKRYSDTLPKF